MRRSYHQNMMEVIADANHIFSYIFKNMDLTI